MSDTLRDVLAAALREAVIRFYSTPYPNNGSGDTDTLTWTVPERAFGDLRRAVDALAATEEPAEYDEGYARGYSEGIDKGSEKVRSQPAPALDVERLRATIHNLRWCKWSDTLHAIAHDDDDEDGYRAALIREYAASQPVTEEPG